MLALVGDRREGAAARLMARMQRDSDVGRRGGASGRRSGRWQQQDLPLSAPEIILAPSGLLHAARPRMQAIGGSHAQRDVYERITVDAGIRADGSNDAAAILAERRARRAGAEDAFAAARIAAIDARAGTALRYTAE